MIFGISKNAVLIVSKLLLSFWLLCVTTTIVIMVVKFSIALSLGLVGALSIVRFRAAIKEPEELVYLFLVIGVGIANGAGQYVAAFTVVVLSTIVFIPVTLVILCIVSPNPLDFILTIPFSSCCFTSFTCPSFRSSTE